MLPIFFCLQSLFTDSEQPTKWTFEARRASETEATVYFKVSIGRGWHLYSQSQGENGPVKTTFTFVPSESFELIGTVAQPEPIIKHDKYFDMDVGYFENAVVFQQQVKVNDEQAVVKGNIRFMICSEQVCLPPQTIEFSIPLE